MRDTVNRQNEELGQTVNKKIEEANKTINQKIDKNDGERRQEIAETNRRLEGIDAVVTLNRAELEAKIDQVGDENRTQVEQLQTDFGNQYRNISAVVNEVQVQGHRNHERIENLQRSVDNRPTTVAYAQPMENRETINFKSIIKY